MPFDPAPLQPGHQLDQREISDEPALGAAEALEAHDPGRPRAQATLTLDEGGRLLGGELVQAFEVDGPADPHECRGPACVQAELS